MIGAKQFRATLVAVLLSVLVISPAYAEENEVSRGGHTPTRFEVSAQRSDKGWCPQRESNPPHQLERLVS